MYPPQSTQIPITLQYKIHLHDNLAELVADRYGYIACGNLEACVTAFFKMASGLDLEKMQVSIDDLLSDNSKHLDYFLKVGGMSHYDHPVNPILSINPGLRPGMLEYIIGIILADREIGEKEVNFVYNMGKGLGLSVKEISVLFAGMVQRNFNPSLDAIS